MTQPTQSVAGPVPGVIRIRGARENNLKGVSLDIPQGRITVFTGVSGSGKSSHVFGTVAAESQRLINETYPAFVQQFLPRWGAPEAEELSGLSAAIVVDQSRLGGNARSTVATVTDAAPMLRTLFARLAEPRLPSAQHYSSNDPKGMCPACEGIGQVAAMDMTAVLDESRSLNGGALLARGYEVDSWWWETFAKSGLFDPDKPIRDFTEAERAQLLHLDDGRKVKVGKINLTYMGLVPKLRQSLGDKDPETLQPHIRAEYDRIFTRQPCAACAASGLNEAARGSWIATARGPLNVGEMAALEVAELAPLVRGLEAPTVAPLLDALARRLEALAEVGLGYLTLDREASSLSGGESQRVKMVRHLGSSLTDMTYVLDEPSVGLHPHDVRRLAGLMRGLRDKGNTVLIVEHKPDMIAIADHVADTGPLAGAKGGEVVYEGSYEGLLASGTLTGRHIGRHQPIKDVPRTPTGEAWVRDATINNLQSVTVRVPLGVLVAVTGVAGSGKSSLVTGCLPRGRADVVVIDQALARGSRRSNTATYTGILDTVRKAFAKANGVEASLFSANSKGACPDCGGLGVTFTDLAHLDPVALLCEACEGRRFTAEVLEHKLRSRSIAEVYAMSVEEAGGFFTESSVARTLKGLDEVGLGYLTLGQPLSTLSGGERQRLKLAAELGRAGQLYVLDEPTTGLHMHDVDRLIGLLDRLVEAGSSVVVIEHNLDVIARAD